MRTLEFRKIVVVGHRAEGGAPLHIANGLAVGSSGPCRMRVAFWVPRPAPHVPRHVGTLLELVNAAQAERHRVAGAELKVPLCFAPTEQQTLNAFLAAGDVQGYVLSLRSAPNGYTLVGDATRAELAALRAGAIEEQIQDYTFDRMPTLEQLRRTLLPHWEMRTQASLGFLPNRPPVDLNAKPAFYLEPVAGVPRAG